jgi:hypothetical protein
MTESNSNNGVLVEELKQTFPKLFEVKELQSADLDRAMHERLYNYIPRFRKMGLYVFPNIPGRKIPKVENWNKRQDVVSIGPEDNYGIRCGEKTNEGDWYLIVLDFEDAVEAIQMLGKELFERLLKETLVIRSAHMGIHIYFLCDSVPEQSIGEAVRKDGKNLMDLLGPDKQVVGPYSVINHRYCEGKKCPWKKQMLEKNEEQDVYTAYEKISPHLKIGKIQKETLAKLFKRIAERGYELSPKLEHWLFGSEKQETEKQGTGEKEETEKTGKLSEAEKRKIVEERAEFIARHRNKEAGIEIPIMKVLEAYGIRDLKQCGEQLYGPHPVHGSESGKNFWVNPGKNVWYCFRHWSGGGPIDLIGVLEGIIQCEEALEPLGKEKFTAIMEKALEKGIISKEEYGKVFRKLERIKTLNDLEMMEIKGLLIPAYRNKSYRQLIWAFLSYWSAKARVSPVCIAKVLRELHEAMRDEEDLKYRASALIYGYKRAEFPLEKFKEELEQALGLKLEEIPNNVIDEEASRKYAGLKDLLIEATNDESQANEIIDKLSDIFGKYSPFRDPVFVRYVENTYFANMPSRVALLETYYDEKTNKMRWIDRATVIMAGVVNLVEIRDPKTNEVYWKATWELARGGRLEVVGTVEDHLEALKANCLIGVKRYAEDAIQSIFNALAQKGYVERQLALETDGFYIDEKGQLQCSRLIPMDEKELKEGVKRGISKLNEVSVFFDQNAFGAMIKAGIILPLSYALKKAKSGAENPRRIYVIGPPGCGKTTLALITGCYIWGTEIERFFRPFKDISTEARLGKVMSQWTFPTLIDNASDLFSDEKYSGMRSVLNSAEESEFVRSVHVRGRYTSIPALSPLIFTIDSAVAEKLNAADKRRAVVVQLGIEHLTQKDASEKIREFNRRYGARCERLGRGGDLMYIGQWLMRYYIENWEEIKSKPWLEVADKALNTLFDYAEEPKPAWLQATISDKEEILESVYQDMKEKVIDAIKEYVINLIIEKGKRSELDTRTGFWDRLNYITMLNIPTGVYALEDGRKYGLSWGKTVIITKKIIDLLIKEKIQLTTLKDLASLMGWEYRTNFTCRALGLNSQSVVFAPLEAIEEIEETSAEKKEDISLDLTL